MPKRSTTSRRKPLAKRSVNIIPNDEHEHDHAPKKPSQKTKNSQKEAKKKIRSTNDAEEQKFVQIKGNKTLYPCSVCKKTGTIKFKPKGSKRLIKFDAEKHEIVKKEPEDPANDDDEKEEEKKEEEKEEEEETVNKRESRSAPQSYKDNDTSKSEEDKFKPSKRKRAAASISYAEESSDEEEEDYTKKKSSPKRMKDSSKTKSSYRDEILQRAAKDNLEEDFGDWRTHGAIDY
mmetsp:Transcript_30108/g.36786  ORF Transcript_30108/g.36786 Transcript_30108/m.36786 type:complete len:233 (-) Transcript_30108:147-845(-)|eukprot:CAMPEP_0172501804 /NCGR_PEP_ID=MMETSP1066-20121228/153670_1 /TAXON_ID=671091 /ORGANISM="Coscinodiscus wailesii, Strain CCMP2513" /LENGTH=232 /DNA_ID=CAMNT_0013276793 /DNA_START=116 /DNA_END=814 /DNA_ORIENTATION=-